MLKSQRLIAASAIALASALAMTASTPLAAQDAAKEDEGPGSGVLMLRAKDGGRLGPRGSARDRHRRDRQRPGCAHPRDPGVPQHLQSLGRGKLSLSAARGRRGRHAQDGRRPARHRRQDQAPRRRAEDLRQGDEGGTQGQPCRAAATEHVHQPRGQYRPRRNNSHPDRISGARAPGRRNLFAAPAAGRRPALRSAAHVGVECRRSRRGHDHRLADRQAGPWPDAQPGFHRRSSYAGLHSSSAEQPISPHRRRRRWRHPQYPAFRRPGSGGPRLRAQLARGIERARGRRI